MDKLKLKWRIFLFLLAFCALLIVLLWFFQTVMLRETYKMIRKAEIEQAIASVQEGIDLSNAESAMASLTSVIESLEADKEIRVMQTNEFNLSDFPGLPDSASFPNASALPEFPSGQFPNRPMAESVTETKEFTLKDGQTLSLTFFALITPVNATVSTLHFQLYIIIGVMLLCAVFLAVIIARRISKPIEEISKKAKILASGDYNTTFAGHGFLEIKELSDTLNTTAAELSKVETLRRELMANISHDLRTPLALIYSYAEMMHDFPNEVTPDHTQTIMQETKRLTSLVSDILDVSKLETGTIELNCTTYNLTESLQDTIERTAKLVKKDGYTIVFNHLGEVYVKADDIKITQVFYNLLTNAIHYGDEGSEVAIRQDVSNGKVRVSITDKGEGIAPEHLPYIWDRYYKIDKTHKRAITGTGLGLSIVKKIMDLHGSAYGVTSELGQGSTFWFELPVA